MDHQRDLRRRRASKAGSVFKRIKVRSDRPRLCVFRSNRFIYVQVIDDAKGHTVAAASSLEKELNAPAEGGAGKVGIATRVGAAIAERAKKAGIDKVVFDRRHYRYHGRIKALADGARKGGLSF
ncbi:MAG: 50S ribosomal protein L18 [Planctomycetes bacterium]|nr:50S ribosomal protein L18 [Planctomycetota bacterium]